MNSFLWMIKTLMHKQSLPTKEHSELRAYRSVLHEKCCKSLWKLVPETVLKATDPASCKAKTLEGKTCLPDAKSSSRCCVIYKSRSHHTTNRTYSSSLSVLVPDPSNPPAPDVTQEEPVEPAALSSEITPMPELYHPEQILFRSKYLKEGCYVLYYT